MHTSYTHAHTRTDAIVILSGWCTYCGQSRRTKGSSTGLRCNEGRFDRKYVAVQSFPSHCRTKGTSHQIRVIRGSYVVYQLTEQNQLCHRGRLWPQKWSTEVAGFPKHRWQLQWREFAVSDRKEEEQSKQTSYSFACSCRSQSSVTFRENSRISAQRFSFKHALCVTESLRNRERESVW